MKHGADGLMSHAMFQPALILHAETGDYCPAESVVRPLGERQWREA